MTFLELATKIDESMIKLAEVSKKLTLAKADVAAAQLAYDTCLADRKALINEMSDMMGIDVKPTSDMKALAMESQKVRPGWKA